MSQFGERVNQSRFDLVDQLLKGQLAKRLQRARKEGTSYDDLAREFAAQGITVSRETLRRWTKEVEEAAA